MSLEISPDLLGLRLESTATGHLEGWFVKVVEPSGARAFTFGAGVLGPHSAAIPPLAEVSAVAFERGSGHVATKLTVPFARGRFARGTLDVAVDGCELSLGHTRGAIATGRRTLEWALSLGPARVPPVLHLGPNPRSASSRHPLQSISLPDVAASGRIEVGVGAERETWTVDRWPAMVGHRWARAWPEGFARAHCNVWEGGESLVLDALTTRRRAAFLPLPARTTLVVDLDGRRHVVSDVETRRATAGSFSLRRWEFNGRARGVSLAGEVSAESDDFVGIHAPNPDGVMSYRLSTAIARVRLLVTTPERTALEVTSRAGALEIGTRDGAHGVAMLA